MLLMKFDLFSLNKVGMHQAAESISAEVESNHPTFCEMKKQKWYIMLLLKRTAVFS